MFGGHDGTNHVNDMFLFDTGRFVWTTVHLTNWLFLNIKVDSSATPGPRAGHTMTVLGSRVILFGGWDGSKYMNDIFFLEAADGQFIWFSVVSILVHFL